MLHSVRINYHLVLADFHVVFASLIL